MTNNYPITCFKDIIKAQAASSYDDESAASIASSKAYDYGCRFATAQNSHFTIPSKAEFIAAIKAERAEGKGEDAKK